MFTTILRWLGFNLGSKDIQPVEQVKFVPVKEALAEVEAIMDAGTTHPDALIDVEEERAIAAHEVLGVFKERKEKIFDLGKHGSMFYPGIDRQDQMIRSIGDKELKDLLKCWDSFVFIFSAKPRASVKHLELLKSFVSNCTTAVGGAIDGSVMNYYYTSVSAEANI